MTGKKDFIGYLLIIVGVFLISMTPSITGAAISETDIRGITGSIFGLIFVIGGLVVLAAGREGGLERQLAREVLSSGKVITKSKELKRLATKIGYSGRKVKEGYQILDEKGEPLTVIPKSPKVSYGVYKSVVKALADGVSSFRRGYR